jgi:hypothetical protein
MAEPTFAMIVPLGGGGARPDQSLPGYGHPDQGLPSTGIPGHLPAPPAGVWPPPSPAHPIVPAPPTTPPGSIWPPPNRPDAGLPVHPNYPSTGPVPPPVYPSQGLPTPPPTVGGGPVVPSGKYWVVVGIPGVGWRYVCVDPSLDAGYPDNTLPGTPSTKPITPPPAQPKS